MTQGNDYYLVFYNTLKQSGCVWATANTGCNYTGIDVLSARTVPQPRVQSGMPEMWHYYSYGPKAGTWENLGDIPTFEVTYDHAYGMSQGLGYMEVWITKYANILHDGPVTVKKSASNEVAVRQKFTFTGSKQTIHRVGVYTRKVADNHRRLPQQS